MTSSHTPLRQFTRTLLVPGLAALALTQSMAPAHAWGEKGHAIIGGIADVRLQSTRARQQVDKILGGQSLSEVASWLDYVRRLQPGFEAPKDHPELANDKETVAFVEQFATIRPAPPGRVKNGSAPWHYVDLPLESKGYDAPGMAPFFVGELLEEDVVMRIQSCIALLQSDARIEGAWGKRNALRTLVHLVGDIHQPLHNTSGFLDPETTDLTKFIVGDPTIIQERKLKNDLGGNSLLFPVGELYQSLHSYWDDTLVDDAEAAAVEAHAIVRSSRPELTTSHYVALLAAMTPGEGWATPDAPDTWPVQWTRDNMNQAREAYTGFQVVTGKKQVLPNQYNPKNEGYLIKLSETYGTHNAAIVEAQLAKGGFRLAKLLDQLWP